MRNIKDVGTSLVILSSSMVTECFAVDGNFRINLDYFFDLKSGLLKINSQIDPRWLIIVDTVNNSFEFDAGLWL